MTDEPNFGGIFRDGGLFRDDGTEIDPNLIVKPSLCVSCRKDDVNDEEENILCLLTRADQEDEEEFVCYAYEPKV
jgi:hypothetical protein